MSKNKKNVDIKEDDLQNDCVTENQSETTEMTDKDTQLADDNISDDCESCSDDDKNKDESKEPSLEDKYAKLSDDYLRLMAEYDNYRKRTLKEKSELIRNGGEKVLKDLLPIVDDFELAIKNMPESEENKALKDGVLLIYNKFIEYLTRQGVKPIETKDMLFDEELHEAIAVIPPADEESKGKIIDCVKTGYTLNDKVLRHSSVVVAK